VSLASAAAAGDAVVDLEAGRGVLAEAQGVELLVDERGLDVGRIVERPLAELTGAEEDDGAAGLGHRHGLGRLAGAGGGAV
jgi:hypothetical protein